MQKWCRRSSWSRIQHSVPRSSRAPVRKRKLKPLEPEQPTLGPERQAFGCWRPCGKGVELVLAEEVDLGLEELVILYRHRRGCLVAEETSLPDGLAQAGCPCSALKLKQRLSQEYSRCAPESEAEGIRRDPKGRRRRGWSVLCMVSHGEAAGATLNSVPEARTKTPEPQLKAKRAISREACCSPRSEAWAQVVVFGPRSYSAACMQVYEDDFEMTAPETKRYRLYFVPSGISFLVFAYAGARAQQ